MLHHTLMGEAYSALQQENQKKYRDIAKCEVVRLQRKLTSLHYSVTETLQHANDEIDKGNDADTRQLNRHSTSLRNYLRQSKHLEEKISQVTNENELDIEQSTAREHLAQDVRQCLMKMDALTHTDRSFDGRHEGLLLMTCMDCYPSTYRCVLGMSK
jgi:hypothetical protein